MRGRKDHLSMLPEDVVTGVLKSVVTLDGQTLLNTVGAISAAYERALGDETERDAALVAAQPMLRELVEKLYSSRSVTVGLDAFGRAVAVAVNGQNFDNDRGPWVVDEIEIPGRAGSGTRSRSFNQSMWKRRGHEAQGLLRRTGRRGRGRVPESKDSAIAGYVHHSSTLQRMVAEGVHQYEESELKRRAMSLVDNPTELAIDTRPALVVDTNVILSVVSRESRTRGTDTGVGSLITSGEVQFGVTRRIVEEMFRVLDVLRRDLYPRQRLTLDDESERALMELVRDHGVNVGWGGRVDPATAAVDETDSKFLRAAHGIVKRYDTLSTFLVTRDTHLLQEQAVLPEAMREKLTICPPTEFLKTLRKRRA